MRRNGLCFERLSTPWASDCKVKLTGNEETLLISNDFSPVSPTRTLENERIPSSGEILTSGLTPVPLRLTETIVVPE